MCSSKSWWIAGDVVFTPSKRGMIASNHRSKHHVWIDIYLLQALLEKPSRHSGFSAADCSVPANLDGLFADPTGISKLEELPIVHFEEFSNALEYLRDRMIVVFDSAEYSAYFDKRTSLLDRAHLGTFHQRLGADLLLRQRIRPDEWWYQQKFNPNSDTLRDNPYKFVQFAFLENFTSTFKLTNKKVLDFGCGSGLAAEQFIRNGADVWGVDPNEEMLEIARSKLRASFTGIHLPIKEADFLSVIPNIDFDLIWMSDVLMFYFYPPDAGDPLLDPSGVLRTLVNYLTHDGKIVIMQPHGFFWLSPWLGNQDRPYTVITEYTRRLYSVSPSLTELSDAIHASGLVIERIYEPLPEENSGADPRSIKFSREFPLWWVFECCKA